MKKLLLLFIVFLLPMVVSADDSGKCGDNVTYTYNEATKTLTISGTGQMNTYSNFSQQPWRSYRKNIQIINIEDGVTNICNEAFIDFNNLTSINIPNSVTSIEDGSFMSCTSLTTIIIPNSVTNIGQVVFAGCSSLTSINIPNNVTRIGAGAFDGCNSLTFITIPNKITTIEQGTFLGVSKQV